MSEDSESEEELVITYTSDTVRPAGPDKKEELDIEDDLVQEDEDEVILRTAQKK